MTLEFLQHRLFGIWRIAAQPGFDELQVFQQQVGEALVRRENHLRIHQLLFINQIDLSVHFLVGLNHLVCLIEPRVLDVMLAQGEPLNAKSANFHSGN